MSIYLSFDGDDNEDFASNKGYGDLCRWVDGLDAATYPQLAHLREYGWCQQLAVLGDELGRALASTSPSDAPTRDVARALADAVRGRPADSVATVTNG